METAGDSDADVDLYTANPNGTGMQVVSESAPEDGALSVHGFDWSPDDEQIAYIGGDFVRRDLYLVSSGGGGSQLINDDHPVQFSVDFAPEGDAVGFVAEGADRFDLALFSANLDSGATGADAVTRLSDADMDAIRQFWWLSNGFALFFDGTDLAVGARGGGDPQAIAFEGCEAVQSVSIARPITACGDGAATHGAGRIIVQHVLGDDGRGFTIAGVDCGCPEDARAAEPECTAATCTLDSSALCRVFAETGVSVGDYEGGVSCP